MKTLFLIRHAKSSWKQVEQEDIERPLNKRGDASASFMGKALKNANEDLGKIISSPANRALSTAVAICNEMGIPTDDINLESQIYEGDINSFIDLLNKQNDLNDTITIFGHNPGIMDLGNYLCNENLSHVPTCGVLKIEFEIDEWKELSGGLGDLKYFDYPKKHEDFFLFWEG